MCALYGNIKTIKNYDQSHDEIFRSIEKYCSYAKKSLYSSVSQKIKWPCRMKYSEELQISYRFATYGSLCIENVRKSFVLHISRLENIIRYCIFFKDVPSKAVQKLYKTMTIANQRSLSNIFYMM